MKYTTVAAILAILSILIILAGVSSILPVPPKPQVVSYSPIKTTVQFAVIAKPVTPISPMVVSVTPAPPSTLVAAINQIQPSQPKPQPVIPQIVTPKPSPTQAYVPPAITAQPSKELSIPSLPSYTLVNIQSIPNFQSLVDGMRRDYINELKKLPTEIAYTLEGTVKGVVEIQTDGNVKVVKIISSPSIVLTDIYVRNIEKFVAFPRSLALEGLEIDATFTPSGTSTIIR